MRKICLIIDFLTGGGAQRLVATLAGEMARRGIETHIITLFDVCKYRLDDAIRYHALSGSPESWWTRRGLAAKLGFLMKDLEQDAPFDLVVTNLARSCEIAEMAGLKGVYHCINNSPANHIRQTRHGLLKSIWRRAKLRRLYDRQHLIAVSRGVARDLENDLGIRPASISLIYNGFDFQEIDRLSAEPVQAADAMQPFVLYVGHFKRPKRPDLVLEAFALARLSHNLVFLGKGSSRKLNRLKRRAKKLGLAGSVFFAGWHENPFAWMKRADLLVFCSDSEGFGRVIVEALAVGTPVASTDCPSGPAEILTGNLRRWLVPAGEPAALADAIRLAIESPPQLDRSAVEPFSIERIVDRYLQLTPRHALMSGSDMTGSA